MNRFDIREQEAVQQVIQSGELSRFFANFRGGVKVQEFEQKFADYLGVKNAISVSNGTVSLEIALQAMGIKHSRRSQTDHEVITTPLSFIATGTAILRSGARPVFVDIDPTTLNMNIDQVEDAITPKTKAIIAVSLNGYPMEMDYLREIADKHGLPILEDAAQALGSKYRKKKIGTWGLCGSFSFQESKNITSLDWHEPIVLLSPSGELQIRPIGDFVDNEKWLGWQCVSFNKNLKLRYVPITGVYRHPVNEDLYELTLENGRKTKVSSSHSVYIVEDGQITFKPVSNLVEGDFCCVPLLLPKKKTKITEINLLRSFLDLPENNTEKLFFRGQKLEGLNSCWKTKKPSYKFKVLRNTFVIPSKDAEIGNKSFKIKAMLKITPELCRLLGYYLAEGNWSSGSSVLTFGTSEKEKELAKDAQKCIQQSLGCKPQIYYDSSKTSVHFGQKYLKLIFKNIFKTGTTAHDKQLPSFLFHITDDLKMEFLRAYYAGDGYLQRRCKGSKINWFATTVSKKMAQQLPYLLLTMKLLPSIEYQPTMIRRFPATKNYPTGYASKCSLSYRIGVRGIGQVNKLNSEQFTDFSSKPQLVECIPTNHAGLKSRVRNNYALRKNGLRTIYEKERITRKKLKLLSNILSNDKWLKKLTLSEIGFAKIKKINKCQSSSPYVYDLCVKGYENFVGGIGGICLHNTGGEGGMIVTDDDLLAERIRNLRNHGNVYGNMNDVICTNARMTEIQAAFGIVQLEKLGTFNRLHKDNGEYFLQNLQFPFSSVWQYPLPSGVSPNYYLLPVVGPKCRDKVIQYFKDTGISKTVPGQNVGYWKRLIYDNPIFEKYAADCPNARWAQENVYLFDIHRWKSKSFIDKTLEALKTCSWNFCWWYWGDMFIQHRRRR